MKFLGFFAILGFLFLNISVSSAGDINWSGRYLLEGHYLKNPSLSKNDNSYSYFSHHLILNPQFIAGDGIVINSRFDIFNNTSYPNSSVGEFFGGSDDIPTPSQHKHATGQLESETLVVNELYLTWANPFGYFIGGRAPVHFGLGLSYNAGKGEFDHWFDTRDMVGYKFIFGNMYVFPMYTKIRERDAELSDDISEWILQAGYENLDTDLEIGLLYAIKKANQSGLDFTGNTNIYNSPNSVASGSNPMDVKTFNAYVKKRSGKFLFQLESSMISGSSGLQTAGGTGIEIDSSALIGEIQFDTQRSLEYTLRAGMVSGDSPDSAKYEGYLVDRNYDISLILFNYQLGPAATQVLGNENYISATTAAQKVDVGYISNAVFVAPEVNWKWNDKWGLNGKFVWAQLDKAQFAGQDKNLGYELDLSIYYKPYERVTLQLDSGYLFTGKAFEGNPSSPNETEDAYAIMTKASIRF